MPADRFQRRRAPSKPDPIKAALRAFDDALAANPDNALLKARRAQLARLAGDHSSAEARLAEVEAAMREPRLDPQRAKDLLQVYDELVEQMRARR